MRHGVARETLKASQKSMKRQYDVKVLEKRYQVGDPVYILDLASIKGKSKKLCPPWKGPGVIVERITAATFRVKVKNNISVINHDRMKLCNDRELPAWIRRLQADPALLLEAARTKPDNDRELRYCLCREPDDGKLMVQCDNCLEWYHASCVGLTRSNVRQLGTYSCPVCETGSAVNRKSKLP